MGKIVANFFTTVDGVVEAPHTFHFPYFNDEMSAAMTASTSAAEAVLLGRTQYVEWAQYWPAHPEDEFAAFINPIRKYVLSDTLTEATWENTEIIRGADAVATLTTLKETTQGIITMSGSQRTVRWLLAHGLLDELHLMIDPIAVGTGERLFETSPRTPLRLISHTAFRTGVLHVVYGPAPEGEPAAGG